MGCQACFVGLLILFAHLMQICCLDILSFLSNKALKPLLHTIYESCIYPFCVCMRVTLDAFNICIEPLWIIAYRAITPQAKLFAAIRVSMPRSRCESHNLTPMEEVGIGTGFLTRVVMRYQK